MSRNSPQRLGPPSRGCGLGGIYSIQWLNAVAILGSAPRPCQFRSGCNSLNCAVATPSVTQQLCALPPRRLPLSGHSTIIGMFTNGGQVQVNWLLDVRI